MNPSRTLLRTLIASLLLACAVTVRAEDKPKSDIPPGMLKKYDKNHDGVLDDAEKAVMAADKAAHQEKIKAMHAEMLAKYDTNKDGKLDDTEKAAARKAMGECKAKGDEACSREKKEKAGCTDKSDCKDKADCKDAKGCKVEK